ncbi:MAG: MBL fold metallo-hydrolase [Armatimonadetes bacterium]|nr:MBL fold metallo-hydrolase [Armatimonadota bacterium]
MFFKQFYLGCLAHASYLIGSNGEAAVVDPRRDVDIYLDAARAEGLTIRYVIETHLHADFVSGHRELADRTGAEIVFGRQANPSFSFRPVADGDEIPLGALLLRFLETPGHTPESISVLVVEDGVVRMALTGDTLFIGDVGRPDLVSGKGFTAEQMASMLYDSLHDKLLRLDDEVGVYPAHGAGSMCGRNIGTDTFSTIGDQKRLNYALQPMPRDAFVRLMTVGLPEVPGYFPHAAEMNRGGESATREADVPALSPADVAARQEAGAVVLDVRGGAAFGAGHVPGSLNLGLQGQFASWAGTLIPAQAPLVVVSDDEDGAHEGITRLRRVGLDNAVGFLDGGMYAWDGAGRTHATLPQIDVEELRRRMDEGIFVLDVRRPAEYAAGHVPGALSIPLSELERRLGELRPDAPTAVVCASGYRSSAAASILQRHGFGALSNVVGGTSAWIQAGHAAAT